MVRRIPMLLLSCGLATSAYGQRGGVKVDSGFLANPARGPRVVYSTTAFVPHASSLRLVFGDVRLSGDPETSRASYLLLTSLADGATQRLDSARLRQWGNRSAYFNGDAVRVDVVAFPGAGQNRLLIDRVIAMGQSAAGADSICGPTDNRVLSADSRVARIVTGAGVCTGFIISDAARCMLTAGQCTPGTGSVVEFNVPMSSAGGAMAHPGPESQYVVDDTSVQSASIGPGNDWCYFGVFANPNTGLGAAAAQGVSFPIAAAPTPASQLLWLTGYGAVAAPVSATWNQVQKSGSGPYVGLAAGTVQHQVDTTAGDSGAPIVLGGQVIGINNGDGCIDPPGSSFNTGTAIQAAALQAALAAPAGLCGHAGGTPEPPIYLATDPSHNLVTVSRTKGELGRIGATGIAGQVNGLAFDRGRGRFYASELVIGGPDRLYRIDQLTGAATLIGTVLGPDDVSGLAFDPNFDRLYGIDQGTGQLYIIDFNSAAATTVGAASGPGVGGIDYDAATCTLYGIDDSTGASRLVKISTGSGTRTVIGALGAGITDCDGLAYSLDDKALYTVDQGTGTAYRVDPLTGAATAIGAAGAVGGSGYGMASDYECAPPCIPNSPIPAHEQHEVEIQANLTWLGCPNQKVFGVDSNPALGINLLYDIMTGSGGGTVIGPTTPGSNQITGLAWSGQSMYAIDLTTGNLLTVDTLSGAPTLVGSTGLTGWQDLAADSWDNGQLYGITQGNRLYRIWFDGAPTLVASNVGSLITAMAFDRLGQLWGIEFSSGRLLKINKATGVVTPVAVTIAGFQGMDFDDAGTLYAHNSTSDSIYTVNLITGAATLRGPSGTDSVKSLQFGRATDATGAPPPRRGGRDTGRVPLFDPTNFAETTPAEIDPCRLIDDTHHGLAPGFIAIRGFAHEAPGAATPPLPTPPPPGVTDALCGGTTINFDDLPAPCTFGLATRLTHEYEAKGVIFEGPGGPDGAAILNQCANLGIMGASGANVVALDPAGVLADGGVARGPQTIRFVSQVSSVQASFASGSPGIVSMQAYRGTTLVASSSAGLTTAMTPLSVFAGGITRVVITCSGALAMDNLCFVPSCPTTYDVYMDTTYPPTTLRASNMVGTVFDPGSMVSTTVYYWRVTARNCCGQIEGPVWRFVTECYANCDHSTIAPFQNVQDFVCFLNRFNAGNTWANCDDSTIPPVLNINDFLCFLNKFAAGCPQ